MKKLIIILYILCSIGSLMAESSHAATFENIKNQYEKGKWETIEMPSGKIFHLKTIFELPEKEQKEAWKEFVSSAWKNAGAVMKKEVAEVQNEINIAKTGKVQKKDFKYIRNDKEIEQYIKESHVNSLRKYKKNCNKGVTAYCLHLAGNYFSGITMKRNYKKAKFYFNKACKQGNGHGCAYVGYIYVNGLGIKKNKNKAMQYFQKACNKKFRNSCILYKKLRNNRNDSNYNKFILTN